MPSLKPVISISLLCIFGGAVAVATAAGGDGAAAPAASNANPTPSCRKSSSPDLRASLEKSLDIKKNASVVIDSINAEELGRFPDADVADSLEHLPGITITRTTGGEGEKVIGPRLWTAVQHRHVQQPHSRHR